MIRINLAMPRKSRKRLGVVQQLVVAAVLVAVEIGLMGSLWLGQSGEIKRLQGEIRRANQELETLKKVVIKVNELEKVEADLKERLQVIAALRENQQGPINLMDLLSRSLPETLWLTSLGEKESKIELEGYSLDNLGVAKFMKNLQSSPTLSSVELVSSQQEVIESRKVQRFKIEASRTKKAAPPVVDRSAPGKGAAKGPPKAPKS